MKAPYGTWRSPIGAELLAAEALRLGSVQLGDSRLFWIEGRPREAGRNVLVRRDVHGAIADVTPPGFDVRSRAHEYGGGAYAVAGSAVWFVNFTDQRIYSQEEGGSPRPLTSEGPWRYADLVPDTFRHRLLCIRETHSHEGAEPVNELVAVALENGSIRVLASGHDFYANPGVAQDGKSISWMSWNHPNMPWDGSMVWVAPVTADGGLGAATNVAGGDGESVFQPQWGPDGSLYWVSDASGWWNLYCRRGDETRPVCPKNAEFALPQWQFGMSTYGFDDHGGIIATYCEQGSWHLIRLDPRAGTSVPIDLPYTQIDSLRAMGSRVAFVGSAPTKPSTVVLLDPDAGQVEDVRCSRPVTLERESLSVPEPVRFPTSGGEFAHGFFYPPRNKNYEGPDTERPPLLVRGHGGPTAAVGDGLNLSTQYWTSRGFAILDVNYRGSTGYGRAYRERLQGEWGIIDVDDCVAGAKFLAEAGKVDAQRLLLRGGSAGGYTTLAALTFRDFFAAGASYYGISDLEALARDTHKFESRYLDRLVGLYPQAKEKYRERSPVHYADQLSCPVIFFQGLEDKVVPPNQAEAMVQALRDKGLAVAYLAFPGEQHGFRRAETIKRAAEAELYFYGRVFGFAPAGEIEPVRIENMEPDH